MQCPACDSVLKKIIAGGVTVEACVGGCGGIWFDRFEIARFDHSSEEAGRFLLNIHKTKTPDASRTRKCPKCPDVVLIHRYYSIKKETPVEHCGNCGGYWVAAAELEAIKREFASGDKNADAEKRYYTEIFERYLDEMKKSKKRR